MAGTGIRKLACLGMLACVSGFFIGCGPGSGIYDPAALQKAGSVAVLPAVGAPGPGGQNADAMQAGVLISALSNLPRYQVQGCASLRRAMTSQPAGGDNLPALQAELARSIKADLLVVSEVADYRYVRYFKSFNFLAGTRIWSDSTFYVTLNVRFLSPEDGRIVYAGSGSAESSQGYGPAVLAATERALRELTEFLSKPAP